MTDTVETATKELQKGEDGRYILPFELDDLKKSMFWMALDEINNKSTEHNSLVAKLQVSEGNKDAAIKSIIETSEDKEIVKHREQIAKLMETIDKINAKLVELATPLLPQALSDDEKKTAQEQIKNLRSQYTQLTGPGLEMMQAMMGGAIDLDWVRENVIHSLKTNGRTVKASSVTASGATGTSKPRVDSIYALDKHNNYVRIEGSGPVKSDGRKPSNVSALKLWLKSNYKIDMAQADIQAEWLKQNNATDFAALGDHTQFILKDAKGNEIVIEMFKTNPEIGEAANTEDNKSGVEHNDNQ